MIKESISIKINPEIWKQAKIQAIEEDITASELVEKALKEKLTDEYKMNYKELFELFLKGKTRVRGIAAKKFILYIIYLVLQHNKFEKEDCYNKYNFNVDINKLSYRDFSISFGLKSEKEITLYLPGSYIVEKENVVTQKQVDNLKITTFSDTEAYLVYDNKYEKINIPKIMVS